MANFAIEKEFFGTTAHGVAVDRYTLRNANGMMIRVITLGATVTELWAPDKNGTSADVVLGFDRLADYETNIPYFGAMVGRVAFGISKGHFVLDGHEYQLPLNNGPHHLHGGPHGFTHSVWHAEPTVLNGQPSVLFTLHSEDGDQGYPGTLDVAVIYTLTDSNELQIECTAVTDRPTLVNLTHHSYFNLSGVRDADVLDHVLQLNADRRIAGDEPDMPSGDILPVHDTIYDFTKPRRIGDHVDEAGGAVKGYDLAYLLRDANGSLAHAATLREPTSGRRLDVFTTEPSIVFYTSNYLDGSLQGKGGIAYRKHAGACLETGRPPDAIHFPNFPQTVLRPGQTYRHTCVYAFSTR